MTPSKHKHCTCKNLQASSRNVPVAFCIPCLDQYLQSWGHQYSRSTKLRRGKADRSGDLYKICTDLSEHYRKDKFPGEYSERQGALQAVDPQCCERRVQFLMGENAAGSPKHFPPLL